MGSSEVPSSGVASIAAVSRDTGLSRDTLRVWERRYGFPSPQRDALGERAYPAEQVHKLRVLKRLLDAGHRPGQVVPLGIEALERLGQAAPESSEAAGPARASGGEGVLQACLEAVRGLEAERLRRLLTQGVLRLGLARFVTEQAGPLTTGVGDAWARGEIQVFEEHLFSEVLQGVLRGAIVQLPQPAQGERPRVLLTTLPGEGHGLGLLMAEALFALEGCPTLSLGVQTPLQEIVRAAAAHRADIVGLSFTACLGAGQVLQGLAELRDALPRHVALWAGGAAPVLQRRPPQGVRVVSDLARLPEELQAWR